MRSDQRNPAKLYASWQRTSHIEMCRSAFNAAPWRCRSTRVYSGCHTWIGCFGWLQSTLRSEKIMVKHCPFCPPQNLKKIRQRHKLPYNSAAIAPRTNGSRSYHNLVLSASSPRILHVKKQGWMGASMEESNWHGRRSLPTAYAHTAVSMRLIAGSVPLSPPWFGHEPKPERTPARHTSRLCVSACICLEGR